MATMSALIPVCLSKRAACRTLLSPPELASLYASTGCAACRSSFDFVSAVSDLPAVMQGGLPLVCPLRCPGALVVVPNLTLRRMVEVLAPARSQALAERAHSSILPHDVAADGIVPALRRARSSLKRHSAEADHSGACSCAVLSP